MAMSKEARAIRTVMDEIAHKHLALILDHDHPGAAHCTCELAQEYRRLDQKLWELSKYKSKVLRQAAALAETPKRTGAL